ncbi:hypothetical protein STEG23_016970, partial [Scotinomys teguina]
IFLEMKMPTFNYETTVFLRLEERELMKTSLLRKALKKVDIKSSILDQNPISVTCAFKIID